MSFEKDKDRILKKMLSPAHTYQTWDLDLKEAVFWKLSTDAKIDDPLLCIAIDLIRHYKLKSKNLKNT